MSDKILILLFLLLFSVSVFSQTRVVAHRGHWDVENGLSVNDPEIMLNFIELGVDYITTDKPVLLQQVLLDSSFVTLLPKSLLSE